VTVHSLQPPPSVVSTASMTILDVGHGNCCIISSADSENIVLVDTGPGVGVLEYLLREGIDRVNSVVLSHADADHISGLIALLNTGTFQIDEVIANSDALKRSEKWSDLAWTLDRLKRDGKLRSVDRLQEGDTVITKIDGVKINVLAPRLGLVLTGPGSRDPKGRLITSNSASAVLLVEFRGRRVALLTGDLDRLGFDYLVESGQNLQADILVFPHHGGLSGSSIAATAVLAEELAQAVMPSDIVFSMDRRKFGNPRAEVVAAVMRGAPSARVACTELAEACAAELSQEDSGHLLPLFASGLARRSCCAGTMRFLFTEDAVLQPNRDAHRIFVERYAGTALCLPGPRGKVPRVDIISAPAGRQL
jgi:beta-lactamase superfamily II metal-dependent hydrolase